MIRPVHFLFFCLLVVVTAACQRPGLELQADLFSIQLDQTAHLQAFTDRQSGINHMPRGETAPLLSLRSGGDYYHPTGMDYNTVSGTLTLHYAGLGAEAVLKVEQLGSHISFELTALQAEPYIDIALWGPYPTTLSKVVGETVGVVQSEDYAIGIRGLNLKTMGGYPSSEDDTEPAYNIFDSSDYVDVDESIEILYRGQTARFAPSGSVLQAYSRDRTRPRVIPVWGHDYYEVPAYEGHDLIGSKIAFFAGPSSQALDLLEQVVLAEGLPYPTMNGEWIKRAPEATASYLIQSFSEANFEETIELTKMAGLNWLYHGGPFLNWGHFDLNPDAFPDNWDSMKRLVERAAEDDIKLGVHTLTNFITTNDPYVTPVPHPGLARVGSSVLTSGVDAQQTTISIADPKFFNQMQNNSLRTVVVGNELIRYESVSETEPWQLLNCERGAFGTTASTHDSGADIGKLMDHAYRTFLTDAETSRELAIRLADLFNHTGLRQISFDGLEGVWASGKGQYARQKLAQIWYDHLDPELQHDIIMDASNPGHHFWNIYTRMNWGEPWYAGFRESQTQYRLLNQDYYSRNLMPRMLGWFSMGDVTSLEDVEWLLARAAGFHSGFALTTSPRIVRTNGKGEEIMNAIKRWEGLRMAGAFPEEVRNDMMNIANEYHLAEQADGSQILYKYALSRGVHERIVRQPGEPVWSEHVFSNPYEVQHVGMLIQAPSDAAISDLFMEINNASRIQINVEVPAGGYFRYTGNGRGVVYDRTWNELVSVDLSAQRLNVSQGENRIVFDCTFSTETDEPVRLEFKTRDEGLRIAG